jgi:hypothetical protein
LSQLDSGAPTARRIPHPLVACIIRVANVMRARGSATTLLTRAALNAVVVDLTAKGTSDADIQDLLNYIQTL